MLTRYSFPGNIRELRNLMERAIIIQCRLVKRSYRNG
jgi:transcriptional regulator with AAA-type ATPase domain